MATKNPFQGDDKDFFAAARGEDGGIKKEAPKAAAPKKQTFSQAFAAARKAGDKTFMFGGKKFSTARADDKKATPATPSLSASKQRDLDKTESRRAAQENMRAIAASRAKKRDDEDQRRLTEAADKMKAAKSTSTGRDKMANESRLATRRTRDFEDMKKSAQRESGPFKEGGKVKKYAKGGGIEVRGKTKCKII